MFIFQSVLQNILNPLVPYSQKISEKTKYKIMILSVFCLNLLCNLCNIFSKHRQYYAYISFAGILCIAVWIFLLLERKLQFVKWDRKLFVLVCIFCASIAISDFFVLKKIQYHTWQILLFLFVPFYYVWYHSGKKEYYIQSFILGTKLYFWLAFFWCFLYRPFDEQYRYLFSFKNPNTLGLYCVFIFMICILSIDDKINQRKKLTKYIGDFATIGACVWLEYASEARTSLLSIGVLFVIYFGVIIKRLFKERKYKVFLTLGVMLVSMLFSFLIFEETFRIRAHFMDNPVEFEGEANQSPRRYKNIGDVVVKFTHLMEGKKQDHDEASSRYLVKKQGVLSFSNSFPQDFIEKIAPYIYSSGRIDIYKSYLKHLNLLGHSARSRKVNGKKIVHSHNNIIQFGYDYGVICLISYVILLLYLLKKSYVFFYRQYGKSRYSAMPLVATIGFLMSSQTEYLGVIFQHMLIILFLFSFGQITDYEYSSECKK